MRKRSPSRAASAQSAAPHAPWHLSRDPILSPWQPPPPPASAPSRWSPPWGGVPSAPKPSPWAGRLCLKRLGGVGVKPAARRGRSRRSGRGGAGRGRAHPFGSARRPVEGTATGLADAAARLLPAGLGRGPGAPSGGASFSRVVFTAAPGNQDGRPRESPASPPWETGRCLVLRGAWNLISSLCVSAQALGIQRKIFFLITRRSVFVVATAGEVKKSGGISGVRGTEGAASG